MDKVTTLIMGVALGWLIAGLVYLHAEPVTASDLRVTPVTTQSTLTVKPIVTQSTLSVEPAKGRIYEDMDVQPAMGLLMFQNARNPQER